MNIEICNLKQIKPSQPYDYKVDRTNKILGNPFFMETENKRIEVCEKYEKWIIKKLKDNDPLTIKEFKKMYEIYKKYNKLRLFCWCYPQKCHAETIKKILEIKIRKENQKR